MLILNNLKSVFSKKSKSFKPSDFYQKKSTCSLILGFKYLIDLWYFLSLKYLRHDPFSIVVNIIIYAGFLPKLDSQFFYV